MRAWLPEICFYDDVAPHPAALNMAMDEALLEIISAPVLRVYQWARPAVSFGYFESWGMVRAAHPELEPVRRWTGGGVVLHGVDLTYSLLIPRGCEAAREAPSRSYALVHEALCGALGEQGIVAEAAVEATAGAGEKMSRECFENPVMHDVLVSGRKVAGAAQRRTRVGLIHQGSVQGVALPRDFAVGFAGRLAAGVVAGEFDVGEAAEKLAAEKYGSREWLERYP